ncbi:hypothetical protein ACFX2F_015152 [Malus domestica]
MTNMSMSPFTDEIEQAELPCKFSMPHFTSFKGDGDPERHLKHYQSTMVLYWSNDALMCQIFATTLQGEQKIGFTPCHHDPPEVLMIFPWFLPKNTHPTVRSRKSPTTCST